MEEKARDFIKSRKNTMKRFVFTNENTKIPNVIGAVDIENIPYYVQNKDNSICLIKVSKNMKDVVMQRIKGIKDRSSSFNDPITTAGGGGRTRKRKPTKRRNKTAKQI